MCVICVHARAYIFFFTKETMKFLSICCGQSPQVGSVDIVDELTLPKAIELGNVNGLGSANITQHQATRAMLTLSTMRILPVI